MKRTVFRVSIPEQQPNLDTFDVEVDGSLASVYYRGPGMGQGRATTPSRLLLSPLGAILNCGEQVGELNAWKFSDDRVPQFWTESLEAANAVRATCSSLQLGKWLCR